jgi:hypothetical protein
MEHQSEQQDGNTVHKVNTCCEVSFCTRLLTLTAPSTQLPSDVDALTKVDSESPPMVPKPVSRIPNQVPAFHIIDTAVEQQLVSKQGFLMSNHLASREDHWLRMEAERRGFAIFVARNVWERCRDVETTLVVLQAMRDAANRACAAATGRAPIT